MTAGIRCRCDMIVRAENVAQVNVPSPPAGEGSSDFQRILMGEGLKLTSIPLTHQSGQRRFHALSRRGRGRNIGRRT